MQMRRGALRGRWTALTAMGSAALLVAAFGTGCAHFDDALSQPFTTEPERTAPPTTTTPPPPLPGKPFEKECPAPGVMQGCLDSTSGLIMAPDGKTALVAERTTGNVKLVSISAEPKLVMNIPVDGAGDGGLMDIVRSPTFAQDRLTYAYISTPSDNRVVRVTEGDPTPKDILTGIPKGATGNTGSLMFTSPTTLLVQTGDAGNPAAATDPGSLAGKLLRIEQPTTVNQAPVTTALSGLGAGGSMCVDPSDGSLYVTDRTPTGDRLQRIKKDSTSSTVWTWPDRPGAAGCAALDGSILVNLVNTKQTVAVRLAKDTGAVTGDPEVVRQGEHGHAFALQLSGDGNVWGATVNRTMGDGDKFDDVVFPLFPQGGFPRSDAEKT